MKEQRKHVHAYVAGVHIGRAEPGLVDPLGFVRISYNPYKKDHFVIKETGERVDYAKWVMLLPDGSAWASL